MTIPTVHLNGTSKDALLEALEKASEALETAYHAIKRTAPNGRDYYPQQVQAFDAAVREHSGRLSRVDGVKNEIDEMIRGVESQG